MFAKSRSLICVALVASTVIISAPAAAQGIPVIDPTSIARIREVVSTASKQLATAKQSLAQVQQMRNTIGQVGPGQIASIMQGAGLDLSGPNSILRNVNTLTDTTGNLNQALGGKIKLAPITDVQSGREAAGQIFYNQGSAPMTTSDVGELRQQRQIALREIAVTSFGAATALKSDLSASQTTAANLQQKMATSPDLRTDVSINTATMLAMFSELQRQTSIQAQLLELDAARTLASDATGRRD